MKKTPIFLLLVIGFLVFMYANTYKSELKIKEETLNLKRSQQILISNFCINQEILYKNGNYKITDEFLVTDELNTNKILLELVDEPKIVFRFTSDNCEPCIYTHINLLASMIKKYGQDKFIVIGNSKNRRQLKIFKDEYKVDFPIFNSHHLIEGVDKYNIPYYFVLSKTGDIDMLHITDKASFDFTKEYFKIVNDRYFVDHEDCNDLHSFCDHH